MTSNDACGIIHVYGGRVDSVLNDIHFIAVFNQSLHSGSDGVILFHEATVPSVYFDDIKQKDGRASWKVLANLDDLVGYQNLSICEKVVSSSGLERVTKPPALRFSQVPSF